jgi:hypothetical protein
LSIDPPVYPAVIDIQPSASPTKTLLFNKTRLDRPLFVPVSFGDSQETHHSFPSCSLLPWSSRSYQQRPRTSRLTAPSTSLPPLLPSSPRAPLPWDAAQRATCELYLHARVIVVTGGLTLPRPHPR